MNAFYEHHKDSIRFGYRCFDRLLLNGLIQPFQQPERVIGFFNSYRQQYPVSRDVLHEVASQFQNWVVNRSQKWDAPILETQEDRRDKFLDPYFRNAKPNQVVAIVKGREPAPAYREARLAAFGQAGARLQQASNLAVTVILKIMIADGTPARAQVMAADLVLKHGIEASEEDIQRCLAELKRPRQVPPLTGPGRTSEEIAWDRKVAA